MQPRIRHVLDKLGLDPYDIPASNVVFVRSSIEAHVNANGLCVITVTQPGRADWRNPAADPTPLVREMLGRQAGSAKST